MRAEIYNENGTQETRTEEKVNTFSRQIAEVHLNLCAGYVWLKHRYGSTNSKTTS